MVVHPQIVMLGHQAACAASKQGKFVEFRHDWWDKAFAPYAAARAQVRRMVSEVGDFLLIHVATPIEVCEARDRKGLYAKARAGLIDQFTGISDPYEEPLDADLTIDTAAMTREQATESVLRLLTSGGWLSQAAD